LVRVFLAVDALVVARHGLELADGADGALVVDARCLVQNQKEQKYAKVLSIHGFIITTVYILRGKIYKLYSPRLQN
jgi:hypothetical protein